MVVWTMCLWSTLWISRFHSSLPLINGVRWDFVFTSHYHKDVNVLLNGNCLTKYSTYLILNFIANRWADPPCFPWGGCLLSPCCIEPSQWSRMSGVLVWYYGKFLHMVDNRGMSFRIMRLVDWTLYFHLQILKNNEYFFLMKTFTER